MTVIDVRCLTGGERTGVGEYTLWFIEQLLSQKEDVYLWYSAHRRIDWLHKQYGNHVLHTRLPNKLVNVLLFTRTITLESLIERAGSLSITTLIMPNLGITNLRDTTTLTLVIHDLTFLLFPHWYSRTDRLWHWLCNIRSLASRAARIITLSEATAWDVQKHLQVSEHCITIVPMEVSEVFSDQLLQSPAQLQLVKEQYALPETYMLFLGTLEPRKNITTLIEAFSTLRNINDGAFANYHLVLAGKQGYQFRTLTSHIANTKHVHYIGYVSHEDKPALYAQAKLFVYPSLYEGYGIPVAEALAVGTPVVTSNRTSLFEASKGNAIFVDPLSVTDITMGMMEAIKLNASGAKLHVKN